MEKLDKQIERDENATRIPGGRDLLGETRVTEAVIQNKGANEVAEKAAPAPAEVAATEPAAKGKSGKGGGKKKHK